MIVLTVVGPKAAANSGLSARFDELGGSIGRADNNQLVLPDPERTISRVHARILYRAGGYVIVGSGSNPIMVNGAVCASGCERPLKPGDQVQIGDYVLAVSDGREAVSNDPFADLFGDGLAAAPAPRAAWPAPRPSPVAASAPSPSSAPGMGGIGIPEDWDPFAPDPLPVQAPAAGPAISEPFSLLGQAATTAEESLDDLFGLGGGPPSGDPLGVFKTVPSGATNPDVLAGFGRPPAAAPATSGDLGSELNTPMPLVTSRRANGGAVPPSGAVFSWEETNPGASSLNKPGVQPTSATPNELAPPSAVPMVGPRPMVSPTTADATAGPTSDADVLLRALIEGLGVPDLRMDALTPEKMHLIGQLLHEATRGTVELLGARAALKRELHADVTIINVKKNNPLKFSPTVDVALKHLLGAPLAGFMPAAPAMRDAFNDLRAHQLGVMAGMRAALEGVLLRFDPRQLEANLVNRSSISNLIPSTRKARLWELFQTLFTQLQGEAQDDFDELFGKAFLRAYESHISRLSDEPGPR